MLHASVKHGTRYRNDKACASLKLKAFTDRQSMSPDRELS